MSDNPYQAPTAPLETETGSNLFSVAIGERNNEYYLQYLEKAGDRKWASSWNWPAFLFTSGWMLYRKLWLAWFLYALAYPLILTLLADRVGELLGEQFGSMVQLVILPGVSFILMPMLANAIYAHNLRRLVAKAEARTEDFNERVSLLKKHGGTSILWILVLLVPAVIGIVAATALPAYQDYMDAVREAANAAASRAR